MKNYPPLQAVVLLLLLLGIATSGYGGTYTCVQYSPEKGLQDRRTFTCAKDYKGYLWVATRTSIDRFDGSQFRHYELPFERDDERVRGVICSPDKTQIFAISNKSVYLYDWTVDLFKAYGVQLDLSSSSLVRGVYFDRKGNSYLLTNEGLYYEDKQSNNWQLIGGSNQHQIYDIVFANNDQLYAGTAKGVFAGIIKSNKLSKFTRVAAIPAQRIQTLYMDDSIQKIWIGSFSNGVYLYSVLDSTVSKLQLPQINVPIREIAQVADDTMWIATDGMGVLECNKRDGKFRQKISGSIIANGAVPNNIYHIMSDGPIVWVCTYSNGLYAVRTKNIVETIYRFETSVDKGLTQNHINAIVEDRNGDLWFATNEGLFIYDHIKRSSHLAYLAQGESDVFLSLFEDSDGAIWAGGYSTKILRINPDTKHIEKIQTVQGRSDYYIYSIAEDLRGNILFGSAIDSLIIYHPQTKRGRYSSPKGVYSILPRNDGTVLLGGISGLHQFDALTGKVSFYDLKNSSLARNPFVYNMAFVKDTPNSLWITTDGQGLCLVDLTTGRVKSWTKNQGFSSNYLYGLGFDKLNRLWITSENGLNCFNPETNQVISLYENIGLPSRSFNFAAFATRRNGNIVCGGPYEAIEIDPLSQLLNSQTNANLHFSDLTIYNTSRSSEYTHQRIPMDDQTTLVLNHKQNTFSLDFANLNQIYGDMSICRWKMSNVDADWNYSESNHRAMYSNLRAGKYLFTTQIITQGSYQVLQEKSVEITIKPPFYATWWAICAYIILGMFLAYFAYRYYLNLMESRHSDEKIRFFINMAHDIRTPITLIKAPLNEVEQESLSENGKTALHLALSNVDKLFSRVSQLLDFQKLERKAMKLQVEKTAINNYFYNLIQSFIPTAKQKQINLTIDLLPQLHEGWIDQPKVSLILENLLSNAIKYTNAGGSVAVRLRLDDRYLYVEVVDDGIGIPSSAQSKIFSRFYRAENASNSKETGSGIGLLLVKRLVALHKGEISFVSTPKCGTIFTVKIPYNKTEYTPIEQLSRAEIIQQEPVTVSEVGKHEYSILLVEDNDELRSYLGSYLRKTYAVFEAENGQLAVDIAMNNNLDIIISDVMMPVMNGFEMCRTLKQNIATSHIPIILLTSLTEREDIIKGISGGADDYIGKPFDLLILETKIDNMIKNRSKRKKDFIENNASVSADSFGQLTEADRTFLNKLYELIEEKMPDELYTVEKMSYDLAMSYPVFYRKVKTLLGITPKEVVVDLKMKKAAELLKEQKYNIGEIAYLVGFPNAKYFSTAFKKYYGKSPSSFMS